MEPDVFDRQIKTLHDRLRMLQQQMNAASASELASPTTLIEELAIALEELHVAQEELHQQHEEVLATRQKLGAERQRYQELFEFAPDGYLVTNAEGIIQEANRAAATLLRVRQNRLAGKPFMVFVSEEDRKALRTFLTSLQESRQPQSEWEVRLQPKGAEPCVAALTVAPAHNLKGQARSLRWLLRDISQRKRAEEMLHEREALLNAILQTTQAVIYLLDTDGRYVYVNRQFEELFQVRNSEVQGKSMYEIFPPAAAALSNTRDLAVFVRKALLETEETVLHPDGQPHVYHSLKAPLWNATGALIGIVGVATDITARKHLEDAVRRREREFSTLVENLPDIVFRLDRELRYLFINRAVEQLSRMSPEHFLHKTSRELGIPTEASDALEAAGHTVFDTGQSQVVELAVRSRFFRLRLMPEGAPNDGVDTLLGILEDITEQKMIEDALRQSEERYRRLAHEREQQLIASDRRISFGELTASLAHEFNNPLGIILGFVQELLKDVTLDHPFHHSLQIIENETQRCRRLMERLMDFARPSPMQLHQINLKAVIRSSLDLVANQCRKQQVVVATLDFAFTLSEIYADPQQLQQVLLNLFFNALEAMPDGGTLTVRVLVDPNTLQTRDKLDFKEVAIMVTDTGTGVAADHLGQIFRPFFTTKTKEGMGLGLSICESIMTAHGGRITVDSRRGGGTTFSLFFPVTV